MNLFPLLLFIAVSDKILYFGAGKTIMKRLLSKIKDDEGVVDKIIDINKASTRKDLVEGDIVLAPGIFQLYHKHTDYRFKRDATRFREKLWKNKTVPYEITDKLLHAKDLIKHSLGEIERVSCLRFVPRSTEKNWIKFVKLDGCFSSIGMVYWRDGPQDISLGDHCLTQGTIIHETLHSLGFWHEHSRPDRDKYVEIFWENIGTEEAYNFRRHSSGIIDTLGVDYDYASIMHYGKYAFSKNNLPTIVAIGNKNEPLGKSSTLSTKDIIQLNALYDCKGSIRGTWSSWSGYGPCDKDCYKTRQRFCFHSTPTYCNNTNTHGVESESIKCTVEECYAPIHGHWNRWQSWSKCSKDCGLGTRTRIRHCDDPRPKYGGRTCSGSNKQSKLCNIKHCGLGPDDCEFDGQGWCFWKNDINNIQNFVWTRHKGSTPTSGTGPTQDHSTGKDYYLYTEASPPALPGNKARLISKLFKGPRNICLSFWYFMYGEGVGALRVFLKERGSPEKEIWGKQGMQKNSWLNGQVAVSSLQEFTLTFESQKGMNFLGDIAIDDIFLKEGGCSKVKVEKIWGSWQPWSNCSNACGYGRRTRKRYCNDSLPNDGEQSCVGPDKESQPCKVKDCVFVPVDGNWGSWLSWSNCNKDCGVGTRVRRHYCNNPAPKDGGKFCIGSNTQSESCKIKDCLPVLLKLKCGLSVKKLGCYLKSSIWRATADLLDTHRDYNSRFFHNYFINWKDYQSSLEELLCHCAARSKAKGYAAFNLHYYGECWGLKVKPDLTKYTASQDCIDGTFKQCVDNDKFCIGTDKNAYFYTLGS